MLPPTHNGHVLTLLLFLLLASIMGGCDRRQTVFLTAEDFRFTPELVRISSTSPLILTLYNAGREVHEFDGPILIYAAMTPSTEGVTKPTGPGIVLDPGKSIQLAVAPPPGTYVSICRRKGHGNHNGYADCRVGVEDGC
jgi:hypothetical protein